MKIALLVGNRKNAGDFLIAQRSLELLQYVYPKAQITQFPRWIAMDSRLDELNQNDFIVFGGGPGFIPDFYPNKVPLIENLEKLKPKFFILGMGWWGGDTRNKVLYNIKFQEKMYQFLQRVEHDTKKIGCRDWYTVRLLKHSGIQNPIMTGCPAWYDVNNQMDKKDWNGYYFSPDFKKICISDPAYIYNFKTAIELVPFILKQYSHAKLFFVFHRGYEVNTKLAAAWNIKPDYLYQELNKMGVSCMDISSSYENFRFYDDCDLHIGFRVHAHIYNISKYHRSILIEEDGRGTGVNQALGLPSLSPYTIDTEWPEDVILNTKQNLCPFELHNRYFFQNIKDYLYCMETSNDTMMKNAFSAMNHYYPVMLEHIRSLQQFI